MCRIMFSKLTPENKTWTRDLYGYLQRSLGGHGNGVAYIENDELRISKGRNFNIHKCIKQGDIAEGGVMLFHTRRASVGEVNTDNCQPMFINENVAIAQNGTWRDYKDWAKSAVLNKLISVDEYLSWTDAKAIAWLVNYLGDDFLSVVNDGVFALFDKTTMKATIYNFDGSFQIIQRKGLWYYASEFDQTYKKHWKLKHYTVISASPDDGYEILCGGLEKLKSNERTTTYSSETGWNKLNNAIGVQGSASKPTQNTQVATINNGKEIIISEVAEEVSEREAEDEFDVPATPTNTQVSTKDSDGVETVYENVNDNVVISECGVLDPTQLPLISPKPGYTTYYKTHGKLTKENVSFLTGLQEIELDSYLEADFSQNRLLILDEHLDPYLIIENDSDIFDIFKSLYAVPSHVKRQQLKALKRLG